MDDEPLYRRQRVWLENDLWRKLVNIWRRLVGLAPIPQREPYPSDPDREAALSKLARLGQEFDADDGRDKRCR